MKLVKKFVEVVAMFDEDGITPLSIQLYIPTGKLHLHGHFDPTSRRVRSTLAEAEPLITKC